MKIYFESLRTVSNFIDAVLNFNAGNGFSLNVLEVFFWNCGFDPTELEREC